MSGHGLAPPDLQHVLVPLHCKVQRIQCFRALRLLRQDRAPERLYGSLKPGGQSRIHDRHRGAFVGADIFSVVDHALDVGLGARRTPDDLPACVQPDADCLLILPRVFRCRVLSHVDHGLQKDIPGQLVVVP